MEGIIKLRDIPRNEDCYVGYKDDLVVFLASQLKEYVEMIPSADDFDLEHLEIIERTSKIMLDLANEEKEDELFIVYDVLWGTMCYKHAEVNVF